jgi:myosin heavy subunit
MSKVVPRKEEINLADHLWVPDDDTVYELAKIIQDHISHPGEKESFVKVELLGKRRIEKEFPKSWTYLVDKTHLQDLNDLIEMNSLHEAPLLDVLRKRWLKDSMYTYTGDFLVSINPYHIIAGQNDNPLRYLDMSPKYDSKKLLDPHVFAVANSSLRKLSLPATASVSEFKPSQSIIVTGESGAGKFIS